ILRSDDFQKPFPVWCKVDGEIGQGVVRITQHANKPHDVWAQRYAWKSVRRGDVDQIPALADHDLRFKWQPALELATQLRLAGRLANDERSCSPDSNDT